MKQPYCRTTPATSMYPLVPAVLRGNPYQPLLHHHRRHCHAGAWQRVNGDIVEHFSKHLFKNRRNAQDGTVEDSSGRPGNRYPFVFVRRDVSDISIVYSEHQWSADVIDHINASAETRAKAMQRVNLSAENDPHTLRATPENLSQLVEDYRDRQRRLLKLSHNAQDAELDDISLDILTTQQSYDLNADHIAAELQHKIGPGNTARIVALYDPVGRQKEIAEAHTKLALWEQEISALNTYPYTIGTFVNSFKNHNDSNIREVAGKAINWAEHGKYWQTMETQAQQFRERGEQFAKLYRAFLLGEHAPSTVGALSTYFSTFFSANPASNEQAEAELQKLCQVSAGLFAGMAASKPAMDAMAAIIEDAASLPDNLEDANNAYYVMGQVLQKIITAPQTGFEWSKVTAQEVDLLLLSLGMVWTKLQHNARLEGNQILNSTYTYLANKTLPAVLSVFGLKIDASKTVTLSDEALANIIAKLIDQSSHSGRYKMASAGHLDVLEKAERKARRGQRLFDWADNQRSQAQSTSKQWAFSKITPINKTGQGLFPADSVNGSIPQTAGLLFEGGFAGLSLCINGGIILSLIRQSRYDSANPLDQGNSAHTLMKYIAAISALTVDAVNVAKNATQGAGRLTALSSAPLAKALAPKIQGKAARMSVLLRSAPAIRLIAVANLAAAVASTLDSINALNRGNAGEATGHAALAIGSGILFAQAMVALGFGGITLAKISAATYFGLSVSVIAVLLGLVFLGIGVVMIAIYGKPAFQILLENCFWGNSKKYAFWFDEIGNRPSIDNRLRDAQRIHSDKIIQRYYRTEFQEFMNTLSMPSLKLEKQSPYFASLKGVAIIYHYRFTLPNFKPGVSEIHYGLVSSDHYDLSHLLRQKVQQGGLQYDNGTAVIDISLELPADATLYWVYEPQPGIIVPMRLLDEDGLRTDIVAGMIDEKHR